MYTRASFIPHIDSKRSVHFVYSTSICSSFHISAKSCSISRLSNMQQLRICFFFALGLNRTLFSNGSTLTVFAPTNSALLAVPANVITYLLDPVHRPDLISLIEYVDLRFYSVFLFICFFVCVRVFCLLDCWIARLFGGVFFESLDLPLFVNRDVVVNLILYCAPIYQ
jgi:hypothetical protein